MGTRSQTAVYDGDQKLVQIYRQYDGYPCTHGAELAEFMTGLTLVNGYGSQEGRIANGAGCFAAQLVGHLKQGRVGHIYLEPCSEKLFQHCYTYKLRLDTFQPDKGIEIEVFDGSVRVFKGNLTEFTAFCSIENPTTISDPY